MTINKQKYEIRQIDSYETEPHLWTWNTSYYIGYFRTASADVGRPLLVALKKQGITFKKGTIRVYDDGDIVTIEERKTDRPLFAAIPAD